MAARLLALREKAVKPEDITTDNLEDSLNFDSKHIERFEAERELHKTQIKQNKELLEDYQAEIEQLKRTIQIEEALKNNKRLRVQLQWKKRMRQFKHKTKNYKISG